MLLHNEVPSEYATKSGSLEKSEVWNWRSLRVPPSTSSDVTETLKLERAYNCGPVSIQDIKFNIYTLEKYLHNRNFSRYLWWFLSNNSPSIPVMWVGWKMLSVTCLSYKPQGGKLGWCQDQQASHLPRPKWPEKEERRRRRRKRNNYVTTLKFSATH